jgi:hypothetical protein
MLVACAASRTNGDLWTVFEPCCCVCYGIWSTLSSNASNPSFLRFGARGGLSAAHLLVPVR